LVDVDALETASKSQQFLKSRRLEGVDIHLSRKPKVAAAKKRDVRRSVQQTGWVTLEGGFAARQCFVHDMSSTGAKITVAGSSVLSGRVRLAFSRDAKKGRQCDVVWRRGQSFGVKFVR
jgi:uncharacterized Ntn-hydrolase superfamily protein